MGNITSRALPYLECDEEGGKSLLNTLPYFGAKYWQICIEKDSIIMKYFAQKAICFSNCKTSYPYLNKTSSRFWTKLVRTSVFIMQKMQKCSPNFSTNPDLTSLIYKLQKLGTSSLIWLIWVKKFVLFFACGLHFHTWHTHATPILVCEYMEKDTHGWTFAWYVSS